MGTNSIFLNSDQIYMEIQTSLHRLCPRTAVMPILYSSNFNLLLKLVPNRVEFQLAPENLALLMVPQLKKVVPRLEIPSSVTSIVCTDSTTLSWVIWTLQSPFSYYNYLERSKDE
jgi:hypothetical protein